MPAETTTARPLTAKQITQKVEKAEKKLAKLTTELIAAHADVKALTEQHAACSLDLAELRRQQAGLPAPVTPEGNGEPERMPAAPLFDRAESREE